MFRPFVGHPQGVYINLCISIGWILTLHLFEVDRLPSMQAIHILECPYGTVKNWRTIPRNQVFKVTCSPQTKAVQRASAHTAVEARARVCVIYLTTLSIAKVNEKWVFSTFGMLVTRTDQSTRIKTCPMLPDPPHIPHELPQVFAWASATNGWLLTACGTARPVSAVPPTLLLSQKAKSLSFFKASSYHGGYLFTITSFNDWWLSVAPCMALLREFMLQAISNFLLLLILTDKINLYDIFTSL